MDGAAVVRALQEARSEGADLDELLRTAVAEIERSEDRYDWVGIYVLEGEVLVLHEYIGRPTDHDRIPVGTGVCGTAVAEARDVNVADVRAVDNYLACSLETRSELVILIRSETDGTIYGQLDLDSDRPGAFGPADEEQLRIVARWLAGAFHAADEGPHQDG